MNAKDRARMARLEAENRELREQVEKQAQVNRNLIYDVVDLKAKLEVVRLALLDE